MRRRAAALFLAGSDPEVQLRQNGLLAEPPAAANAESEAEPLPPLRTLPQVPA